MNRLDEALARLERAVARLEAALVASGGNAASSRPVAPGVEPAASRPVRGTRGDATAGTLAGEQVGVEGEGGE